MAMNFETSLLSSSELESSGSGKFNHTKEANGTSRGNNNHHYANGALVGDQETREILRQFLERSLSQSAKNSSLQFNPEGYHHLKEVGKLAFYQRQQSKPEQGVLVRRESSNKKFDRFKPSQNDAPSQLVTSKSSSIEKRNFSSGVGYRKERSEEKSKSRCSLEILKEEHKKSDSSDSISSEETDVKHQLRRKSFNIAARKSVISLIETNKQKVSIPGLSPDKSSCKPTDQEASSSQRKSSVVEDGVPTLQKQNSISGRFKKVVVTSSNKQRSKYKKSIVIPHNDGYDVRTYKDKTPSEPTTASSDVVMLEVGRTTADETDKSGETDHGMSVIRHSSSLKRKTLPSEDSESSDSPPKTKSSFRPSQALRSFSFRRTPKVSKDSKSEKRLSSSLNALTTSFDHQTGSEIENKSGSLPLPGSRLAERSISVDANKSRQIQDQSQARPRDLDLSGKKKGNKFKRFIRSLWKRQPKSSQSNLFHSHPTNEQKHKDGDVAKPSAKKEPLKGAGDEPSPEQRKHFHHRGSNSFSPGDKLNSENRRMYEEFVETLDRVSSHYCRHMRSRSNTPGSRINTPESSLSSSEYHSYAKGSRSGPPSRQASNLSAKFPSGKSASGKSYRQFKDESRPALAAFHNIRTQQNNLDVIRGNVKKPVLRRHTHHSHLSAYSHRHERHRLTQSSKIEGRLDDVTDDAVDGIPYADGYQSPTSRKSSASSADVEMHDVVDSAAAVVVESRDIQIFQDGNAENLFPPPPPASIPAGAIVDNLWDPSRPSTSAGVPRNGYIPPSDEEVEKLVMRLANCIRDHGDRYNTSMNTPDIQIEPLVRECAMSYLSTQTSAGFRHFADLLYQHLNEDPHQRNPEALSIAMAFNVSRYLCNLFTNQEGEGVFQRIVKYSTSFVMDILETTPTSLPDLTAQLQATDFEISRCESTDDSPCDLSFYNAVD